MTPSEEPFGRWMGMKSTIRLSARSTPADPVHEILGRVVGEIDVLGVAGGDPEVGLADGKDGVGGIADQPLEESHLHQDQHD